MPNKLKSFKTDKSATEALYQLELDTLALFAPPPDLSISDWADKYRMLSPESSAEPGQWDTSRFEPQRGIMDAISDNANDEIVCIKSAQVGWTEIINNTVGYFAHQDPSNMLIVQPTEAMGETWSKDRLAPMIRDTPVLKDMFGDPKTRNGQSTTLHKAFKGGQLAIAGSNSPAGLASRPVRLALFDEVDRFPPSAGTEGDPVNLGKKRTQTYWNRKILMGSTPTIKSHSRIEKAFEATDKRYYFVPCPHCDHKQTLRWANVEWEEGKPETAHYRCESCGDAIHHSQKAWMVKHGEWKATSESTRLGLVGFHISELYSPWSSWEFMAKGFVEAKKSVDTLKTWINTSLGETFEEEGEKIDGVDLYNRREKYDKIPDHAILLTSAVDVQDNRLEMGVYAHGPNNEAWAVDHIIAYGNPVEDAVWDEIEKAISDVYERESGGFAPISGTGVDTGGHFTTRAYQFCAKLKHKNVMAFKGHSVAGKPAISRPKLLYKHNVNLYTIGVDTIKDNVFARIQIESGCAHSIHFPFHFDPEFFAQLTAEKRVTAFKNGIPYTKYIKTRSRNEALDILVYNIAVLTGLNVDLDSAKPVVVEKDGSAKKLQTVTTKASQNNSFIQRQGGGWINRG